MTGVEEKISALYSAHLAALLEVARGALVDCGFEALLIHSGMARNYFNDDQEIPFRPNPSFAHFIPLREAEAMLLVKGNGKPVLIRVRSEDYWREGVFIENEFWTGEYDVREVPSVEAAWKEISEQKIAFVGEAEAARGVSEESVNPLGVVSRLAWRRSFKTRYEIECIRHANAVAAGGHRAARHAFLNGASEFEIHSVYISAVSALEAELPYETVVALDEKSAILHYGGKRHEGSGDVFLLDAGAAVLGYASDITRTWIREQCDPLFADLLEGVEKIQKELALAARPGVSFSELHAEAHRKIAELLYRMKLLYAQPEEAVSSGFTRAFFPHGLGHFLGIQVHDVGGNQKSPEGGELPAPPQFPKLRMTRTIEEGMVFTIEPGVYFIEMLLRPYRKGEQSRFFNWNLIDRLAPMGGIRIEDDLMATKTGNKNLTREFLP